MTAGSSPGATVQVPLGPFCCYQRTALISGSFKGRLQFSPHLLLVLQAASDLGGWWWDTFVGGFEINEGAQFGIISVSLR